MMTKLTSSIQTRIILLTSLTAALTISIAAFIINHHIQTLRNVDIRLITESLTHHYQHLIEDEFFKTLPTQSSPSNLPFTDPKIHQTLQQLIGKLEIPNFEQAYTTLYLNDTLVFIGKDTPDTRQTAQNQQLLQHIHQKQPFLLFKDTEISYGTPFIHPHTNSHFTLVLTLPSQHWNQQSTTLTVQIFITNYLAALTIIILIILFLKIIFQALRQAAQIANTIAQGNLDNPFPSTNYSEIEQFFHALQEMQSQLKQRLLDHQTLLETSQRINQALHHVSTGVLIADPDYQIIYINPAAEQLFLKNQEIIREYLPQFDAKQLLNSSIHQFHRDIQKKENLLCNLTQTYQTFIQLGNLAIEAKINPVFDPQQHRLGWVTEFTDRSLETTIQQEIDKVVIAATQGDYKQRIDLENKDGFFLKISQGINQTLAHKQALLQEIMRIFSGLAKGDLTQTITKNYQGTFETIKFDVNTTVSQFSHTVDTLQQTTHTLNQAMEELTEDNHNLSQRTEQQASFLQETASSLEQITSTVQQNTENARKATHLAMKAREKALQGGQIVNSAVAAINEINQSSREVSEIITLINEIAFQTNLLALNAAVEAARAGDQGRGFAVVAGEVRNLAQRSAHSARQIKGLLQNSVKKVEEGTLLVNQSGETLENIIQAVREVSDIIIEIAAASQQQSAGIQQINKAITQMDEMTQQNAAMVQQATVASACLREQVQHLKEQILFFKIA